MKKLSILIADDAPDVCALLSLWLEAHHTACVHSGQDALDALALLHFDLVIADIHMPDLSGIEIIKCLKRCQPWVRILAVSGGNRFRSPARSLVDAVEMGADGILLKPFDRDQLLTRINACWLEESDTAELYRSQ